MKTFERAMDECRHCARQSNMDDGNYTVCNNVLMEIRKSSNVIDKTEVDCWRPIGSIMIWDNHLENLC